MFQHLPLTTFRKYLWIPADGFRSLVEYAMSVAGNQRVYFLRRVLCEKAMSAGSTQEELLRDAFDWFVTLIGGNVWECRRKRMLERLNDALRPRSDYPIGKLPILLGDEEDRFAWNLFVCESYLRESADYEPMQGSRVIPAMIAIGRNLKVLTQIPGACERAVRLATSERRAPEAGIFELLVAGCYLSNGWASTRFIPEDPNVRTYDLDVSRDQFRLAVECKRLSKSSDYALQEREQFWRMWGPLSDALLCQGLTVGLNIIFHVELGTLPTDFLTQVLGNKLALIKSRTEIFADSRMKVDAWHLRPELVRTLVQSETHRCNPGRFKAELYGGYERFKYFAFSSSPRGSVAVHWSCDSVDSIRKKARHILRHVANAVRQFPANVPSAIHVGIDALDGDLVESLRYAQIAETLSQFDAGNRRLERIYVNVFVPECPPDENWAIDETVYWIDRGHPSTPVLRNPGLIVPDSIRFHEGPHWLTSSQ